MWWLFSAAKMVCLTDFLLFWSAFGLFFGLFFLFFNPKNYFDTIILYFAFLKIFACGTFSHIEYLKCPMEVTVFFGEEALLWLTMHGWSR